MRSISAHAGGSQHLRPFRGFQLDVGRELLRRIADGCRALPGQLLLYVGQPHRLRHLRVQSRNDVARRAGRMPRTLDIFTSAL